VRSPSPANRGAITAEWALTLPAVVTVFLVLVGSSQLITQQRRLQSLSADATRLIGLGVSVPDAHQQVNQATGADVHLDVSFKHDNTVVCVEARESLETRWWAIVESLSATHCGLYAPARE